MTICGACHDNVVPADVSPRGSWSCPTCRSRFGSPSVQDTAVRAGRAGSWRIVRASCACGGRWAWVRTTRPGAVEMQGCVCHHPWTLALRAGPGGRVDPRRETF
jgi:hypothetical protein